MATGKYDNMFVTEHVLCTPELEPRYRWDDCMCTSMKGSYTCLTYNTINGDVTKWNKYCVTDMTLTTNMSSLLSVGKGSDHTKLGSWTLGCFVHKNGTETAFVSAFRPSRMSTV